MNGARPESAVFLGSANQLIAYVLFKKALPPTWCSMGRSWRSGVIGPGGGGWVACEGGPQGPNFDGTSPGVGEVRMVAPCNGPAGPAEPGRCRDVPVNGPRGPCRETAAAHHPYRHSTGRYRSGQAGGPRPIFGPPFLWWSNCQRAPGLAPRLRDPGNAAHRGRGSGPVTSSSVLRIRESRSPRLNAAIARGRRGMRRVGSGVWTPRGRHDCGYVVRGGSGAWHQVAMLLEDTHLKRRFVP